MTAAVATEPVATEPVASEPVADARYCPVCRKAQPSVFRPGPGKRPDASCPSCGSLERHRFLAVALQCLQLSLGQIGTLLDIAPSKQVTPMLAALEPQRHLRLDLGADSRMVDVLGSLTALPLPDDSVDLLVCYHVLEHIPDDRAAMRELARVLAPGGVALLQVPYRRGTLTDEDPDAPVEERLRRFGQADHVRYYGDDFEDRLVESGLAFERIVPSELVGPAACSWMRLRADETVWLATPAADAVKPKDTDGDVSALGAAFDTVLRQQAGAAERATRAEERVADLTTHMRDLERDLRRLRRPRSVRAALGELRRSLRFAVGWRVRRLKRRRATVPR